MGVWCFLERKTALKCEDACRCRGKWGCDETRQTEVASPCGQKGCCCLCGGMCYVVGGGDGSCRWKNTVSADIHLYIHPIISVLSIFDSSSALVARDSHPYNKHILIHAV